MRKLILFFLLNSAVNLFSQGDMQWWNEKHNWDGNTRWTEYLTYSPKYFGPNALVTPEVRNGLIEEKLEFEFRPEYHFMKGENTVDIYTSLIYPLKGIASFEVYIVPIEYYSITDTILRDERAIRSKDPKDIAGGDFYFGTNIQVIKDKKKLPDITFSAYYKTASGTNLSDARYTDAPAYYIHLSFGKKLVNKNDYLLRVYGNLGTYIWQTFEYGRAQNDAFLYGIGFSLSKNRFEFNSGLSGYSGYIDNGDSPLVLRMKAGVYSSNKRFLYSLHFNKGLHDYDYNTLAFSATYKLKIKQ